MADSGPLWRIGRSVVGVLFLLASLVAHGDDLTSEPTEALLDRLTQARDPGPGLHPTASAEGFIGTARTLAFGGGVLGSAPPAVPPAMREIVRRGAASVPVLLSHLSDARPTLLTVGGDFFMFRFFSAEYDPRDRRGVGHAQFGREAEQNFAGDYTVKVGDVCYALLGQIVNRLLVPVRYQPSGGFVVNSPVQMPTLAERARRDWRGFDTEAHRRGLIRDALDADSPDNIATALTRLRFYFPDDYSRPKQRALRVRIHRFERDAAQRQKAAPPDESHRGTYTPRPRPRS